MVEYKGIQAIVSQVLIQAATAGVMVLRETEPGPRPSTNIASLREAHRQRHGGAGLKQPSVNWNVRDKHVEILHFEMEVTNILQTKTYEINDEGNICIIKNW